MDVAEIDVVCPKAGDLLVEGDGNGDQSVIVGRGGDECNDDGGAGRLVVDVVGDEVDVARARVARGIGDAGHVDADLQVLHCGVGLVFGRLLQIYFQRLAAVGGARILRRAHARRYRQVSRCEGGLSEGGLSYPLGEGKGDGAYLVGAGQGGVADRRGARESGRPGVDDEDGAGGVVAGASNVVDEAALGSVQV